MCVGACKRLFLVRGNLREPAGALLHTMTRGSDTRTPSNWASNSQSRLAKQKLNRSQAGLETTKPTLRTHRREITNCSDEVTSTLANLKFTWTCPDLASGVVACFPHVLIKCTRVASRAASGPASRALSAIVILTTVVAITAFDIVYLHARLCSCLHLRTVPRRKYPSFS